MPKVKQESIYLVAERLAIRRGWKKDAGVWSRRGHKDVMCPQYGDIGWLNNELLQKLEHKLLRIEFAPCRGSALEYGKVCCHLTSLDEDNLGYWMAHDDTYMRALVRAIDKMESTDAN